jgi:septal ring factor EnvC (AmiA/AmiB activator)
MTSQKTTLTFVSQTTANKQSIIASLFVLLFCICIFNLIYKPKLEQNNSEIASLKAKVELSENTIASFKNEISSVSIENKKLKKQVNEALVIENNFKEAAKNHIIIPVKQTAKASYDYSAEAFSDITIKIKEAFNKYN